MTRFNIYEWITGKTVSMEFRKTQPYQLAIIHYDLDEHHTLFFAFMLGLAADYLITVLSGTPHTIGRTLAYASCISVTMSFIVYIWNGVNLYKRFGIPKPKVK